MDRQHLAACVHRLADEEDLMLLHGYPGINMFNGIWDWFAQHILVADKRVEPFLQARGCR